METLGQQLGTARERKKKSPSEAAKATRIKVQHIEAMERDDFSGIAAPAYAKGFIKIYAEYLGIDPEPLIEEYLQKHAPKERPALMDDEPAREPGRAWTFPEIRWTEIGRRLKGLVNGLLSLIKKISTKRLKKISIKRPVVKWPWPNLPPHLLTLYILGVAFFVAVLIGVSRYARRETPDIDEAPVRPAPPEREEPYPLIRDVPDPYLDEER